MKSRRDQDDLKKRSDELLLLRLRKVLANFEELKLLPESFRAPPKPEFS